MSFAVLWFALVVSLVKRNTAKCLVFLCGVSFVLFSLYKLFGTLCVEICLRFSVVNINFYIMFSFRVLLKKLMYIDLFT